MQTNGDNEEPKTPRISPFEAIRREGEDIGEYWSARDLAKVLAYDNYRNFLKVIAKARIACEQSGQATSDHFVEADEMIEVGKGARRKEELPTPKESIQQLQQREKRRLEQGSQLPLLADSAELEDLEE